MKYLYECHTGSLFITEKELENTYCDVCGDSDHLIGAFNTLREFWDLIKDDCDIDGCGGWNLQYLFPMIVEEFDLDCNVIYDSFSDETQGFCSNSDQDIIEQIQKNL